MKGLSPRRAPRSGGRFSERANLIIGGETHIADSTYLNNYFRSGAFTAGSGFRDVGAFMHFVFMFSERVYGTLDTCVSLLLGDAAQSPLTVDDLQYFLGSVVGYRF